MIKYPNTRVSSFYIAAGIMLLLCGYVQYLIYRVPDGTVMQTWPVSQLLIQVVPYIAAHAEWMDWMPSFIYVLALSLVSAGMFGGGQRYRYAVPLFWMVVASLFEVGQYFHIPVGSIVPASWGDALPVRYFENYFRLGTFDPLDMAAGFGGMLVAIFVLAPMRVECQVPLVGRKPVVRYLRKTGGFAVCMLGIACLLATSQPQEFVYDPVYLSYSDLRIPVTASTPEALTQSGKIYLYGNLILFNERNRGIHVIDNTNPSAPVNLLFLPVPGNIDIAVKDNILYADSFIDLVAIDISDLSNIHEVNRVQSVFPYDPYQNITDRYVYFSYYDETKGVVVGYKSRLLQ